MVVGSNLSRVQAFNRRIVLEMIRVHGPISRADITRGTNLTRQTISNIVADFTDASMVVVTGQQKPDGGGKPSDILEINPAAAYSVGINLYLDELTGVLVDFAGNILQRVHRHVQLPSPSDAAPVIEDVAKSLVQAQGIEMRKVWGAGIGLPGPLSTVRHPEPTPLSAWREAAVVDEFSELIGVPVYFENNANAGAIGERWYGAGQHLKNFVYFSFGVFLGGGIIVNGQLFSGSGGFAAEFGDVPTTEIDSEGDVRSLSEIASPSTLMQLLEASGANGVEVEDLASLLVARHPVVMSWLDRIATHLAPLLTTLEYVLDPEAIIFGGRLPDPLMHELLRRVEEKVPPLRTQNKPYRPQLLISRAGADAAALGAATLPLYQTLDPNPTVLFVASDPPSNGADRTLKQQLLNV